MKKTIKSFRQLTNTELYACLKLRSDVFVVEQQCVYPELDDVDQQAWHLLLQDEDRLAGYLRLFVEDEQSVIGRVVVAPQYRGQQLGRELMQEALMFIASSDGLPDKVYVMAQQHLEDFYQSLGFVTVTEPFDEDGILHVGMVL